MQLVYPVSKPDQPYRIYESATMAIGNIAPENRLKINGEEKTSEVSAQGFFAIKIVLNDGGNLIRCQELAPDGRILAEASSTVMVALPLAPLSYDPLQVHPETMTPQQEMALLPGDTMRVAVSASDGADVGVMIDGVLPEPVWLSAAFDDEETENQKELYIDNRSMVFKQWHQMQARIARKGYCEKLITIPETTTPVENAAIRFVLRNDYQERTLDPVSHLSVWASPKTIRVHTDRAVVRTGAADDYDRLTPQRKGVLLAVDRQEGDWLRAVCGDDYFWIQVKDVMFEGVVIPPAPPQLSAVWMSGVSQHITTLGLALNEGARPPVLIDTGENTLSIFLPGVVLADMMNITEERCEVKAVDGGVKVSLSVPDLYLSGYDYRYGSQGVEVLLKTLPKTPAETRILIDPGHGGDEWGSTGPSGLPEKTLNLLLAKQLLDKLSERGFQVSLSRGIDRNLSLLHREKIASEIEADIVLSIHHNALPDGRDPKEHEGACTFYYHAFSKPLAIGIENALVQNAGQNLYGVFHESFYMTRFHHAVSVLIELGFFTKPDEFERLINPEFQQQATEAIAKAVEAFITR